MNSVSLSILLENDGGSMLPRAYQHDGYPRVIGSIEFGRGTQSGFGVQASSPEAFDALAKAAAEVAEKMRIIRDVAGKAAEKAEAPR